MCKLIRKSFTCYLLLLGMSWSHSNMVQASTPIPKSSVNLYVAINGNDKNKGTIDKPFASLAKAQDAIRQIKKEKGLPKGGITVFIKGGNYFVTSSVEITADDSGEEGKPVIYSAYENESVHFIGGIIVDARNWKPINAEAKKRLHPKADANKIFELDVNALGLRNVKEFAPTNHFTTDWFIIDLFADNKRQPISQWPNLNENIRGKNDPGWTNCNGSKDNSSFYYGKGGNPEDKDTVNEVDADGTNRAKRWQASINSGHELWLKGLWRTPWEPHTIKVKEINTKEKYIQLTEEPPQGMGSKYTAVANTKPLWRVGSGKENWYAINYLDEIDQPGEWALDFKDKKLYYYAPSPIEKLKVMISDMKSSIIDIKGAQYVQIKGLTIEGGLGNGIEMNNCSNMLIAGCTIVNVGNTGVKMGGGEKNIIQANDIYETAGWGLELRNLGNRQKLTAANVQIINNHIHHVGQLAFKEAIVMNECVGVTIAHNLLNDIPKGAIRTDNINDCIFEYNEIHNIALKEGDTGVFYNYGGWSTYGNIFRYNFSHHTNRANGFYSDDGDSGDSFYKNIVQGTISAVKFGGGHDDLAENNLIVESKDQSIDDRGKDRNYRLGTNYETNLVKFNLNTEPWKSYGIRLKAQNKLTTNLWNDVLLPDWHPEFPNGSRMKNNVVVAGGAFKKPQNGNVVVSDNTIIPTIKEAAFYNYGKMDLRTLNKQILEKIPELNEVFPKIGLQIDVYRLHIPTREETGGLVNRSATENLATEDQMIDKVVIKH